MIKITPDPLGLAVQDYYSLKIDLPLTVHTAGFDPDAMQPSYFFRTPDEMPFLEKEALRRVRGKVLDIGACAGAHSLVVQENGTEIVALESSALCCEVMRRRGIKEVVCTDIFQWKGMQFDTLLLLMNGLGIAGSLPRLSDLLRHLKTLMKPGAQLLADSSDLIYLFEDEEGEALIDVNSNCYYGELEYRFEYKGIKGDKFPWLYVDAESLQDAVDAAGLKIVELIEGDHYDYLAVIEEK